MPFFSLAVDTTSPLWLTTSVALLSAMVSGLAVFISLKNLIHRERIEHDDASCRRAKRVIEQFHDGMLVVNRDLRIVLANRQARAITGYTSDLEGMSVYDLIPEEYRDRHREHVARYFDDPHTRRMGTSSMQLWLEDRQHRKKRVALSLTHMEDDYGSVEVAIGMHVMTDEEIRVQG